MKKNGKSLSGVIKGQLKQCDLVWLTIDELATDEMSNKKKTLGEKAIIGRLLIDNFDKLKQNSLLGEIHELVNLEDAKKGAGTMDVAHCITDAILKPDKRNEQKQERGRR